MERIAGTFQLAQRSSVTGMSDLFPNSPLASVIFELRFPGETAIEFARPRLQAAIRDELPKLLVPRIKAETPPPLQPYVFRSDDDSEGVEIALHTFAYVSRRYAGFAAFKSQALKYVHLFAREAPEVRILNRVGLRYVNHIPVLRDSEGAAIPLGDYLNIDLRLPAGISSALTELNSTFSLAMDDGQLRVVVRHERAADGDERLVLDFDFAQGPGLPIARIGEYIEKAHSHTKRTFLALISERYLPVLRGEE